MKKEDWVSPDTKIKWSPNRPPSTSPERQGPSSQDPPRTPTRQQRPREPPSTPKKTQSSPRKHRSPGTPTSPRKQSTPSKSSGERGSSKRTHAGPSSQGATQWAEVNPRVPPPRPLVLPDPQRSGTDQSHADAMEPASSPEERRVHFRSLDDYNMDQQQSSQQQRRQEQRQNRRSSCCGMFDCLH